MKLESAPRWSGRRWFALGLVLATACGDDPGGGGERRPTGPSVTLPLAEQALDDPDVTTVATDLAPSQTGGSTVPDPPTPEPCGVDDVEMWTAQVARDGSSAVVRMRNVSDRWCEPDIGRSPLLDPAIEPDVWLLPDATADLVVGPSTSGCADPAVVDAVQVGIGDESVLVPTALVTCGWWFTAFAPTADVRVGCELADIDVAVTAVSVVVRNASARPCALSGPVGVDGAAVVEGGGIGRGGNKDRQNQPQEDGPPHPGMLRLFWERSRGRGGGHGFTRRRGGIQGAIFPTT